MFDFPEYDELCKGMYIGFTAKLSKKNSDWSTISEIESFILDEAIIFFIEREEYEKCQLITDFKNKYSEKIVQSSREEFFEVNKWESL